MVSRTEHWDAVFSAENDQDLGWYEHNAAQTLKFFKHIKLDAGQQVFLAGAGTSNLVDALFKMGCHLILNDISGQALNRLKNRLGEGDYQTLQQDMSLPLLHVKPVDIWIDRAVLHFLLGESAIEQYFDNVRASIKQDGYVLLAEFAKEGAQKCSGLSVHQYSVEEMQARLGDGFVLIESEDYLFVNPQGHERPYVYALFQRTELG